MTMEEIELLKSLVMREHRSDVIRALEEMERAEKRRQSERAARGETVEEQEMRERARRSVAKLVRQIADEVATKITE